MISHLWVIFWESLSNIQLVQCKDLPILIMTAVNFSALVRGWKLRGSHFARRYQTFDPDFFMINNIYSGYINIENGKKSSNFALSLRPMALKELQLTDTNGVEP